MDKTTQSEAPWAITVYELTDTYYPQEPAIDLAEGNDVTSAVATYSLPAFAQCASYVVISAKGKRPAVNLLIGGSSKNKKIRDLNAHIRGETLLTFDISDSTAPMDK